MDITQTSFNRLFSTGSYENLSDLSDSTLRTEDGFAFDVHRIVLARENRYFRALFCGIGQNRRDFLVPGIRGEILDLVLTHIYHGSVHLTQSNVCELLVASDYLLADGLTSQIKKNIEDSMSLDNCISFYTTALKLNQGDIMRWGYRFIQTHFGAIVDHQAVKIGNLPLDIIKNFLDDKNLCVQSEHEVWSAIQKWVQHDASNRLRCVPELIQCLKVSDTEESLAMEILFSDIVAKNPFFENLHKIKSEADFASCLDILVKYHMKIFTAPPDLLSRRRPARVHLIARYHVRDCTDVVQLYLTYDERLDSWRKLGEIEFCPTHIATVDFDAYVFDAYGNSSVVFNLVDKRWREMPDVPTPRLSYHVLSLRNVLYVIGGESPLTGEELMDVEFYNPYLDMWFPARSMFPVTCYSAAAFRDCIFVVGKQAEDMAELGMMAQVYSVESDFWTMLPAPNVFRSDFALAAHRGKLYIIGGSDGSRLLQSVEVLDFDFRDRQAWQSGIDLPHAFYFPKVVVLDDELVVFDGLWEDPAYFRKNPPVSWNEDESCWKVLGGPFNDLEQYLFCTIEDDERMATILRENRDPATRFEKSFFV